MDTCRSKYTFTVEGTRQEFEVAPESIYLGFADVVSTGELVAYVEEQTLHDNF